MSRDEEQARKFAVEWSTKGKGKIANLAGCYLQALAELERMRAELAKALKYGDRMSGRRIVAAMPGLTDEREFPPRNRAGCGCEYPDEKCWRGWCNR